MAAKKKTSKVKNKRGTGKTTTAGQLTLKDQTVMKQRAERNESLRKKELRDKIDASRLLNQIEKRSDELITLSEEIKTANNTARNPEKIQTTINKAYARASIIGKALDTHFKLLAKRLPDLKSIEVTDEDGNNVFSAFADAVKQNDR